VRDESKAYWADELCDESACLRRHDNWITVHVHVPNLVPCGGAAAAVKWTARPSTLRKADELIDTAGADGKVRAELEEAEV
jgi:hypothetical protein